jgi:hypothetical protein
LSAFEAPIYASGTDYTEGRSFVLMMLAENLMFFQIFGGELDVFCVATVCDFVI